MRLFVCLIYCLQPQAAGLLPWAWWVGDLDRLLHGWRHSITRLQQQMGVVPRLQLMQEAVVFVLVDSK